MQNKLHNLVSLILITEDSTEKNAHLLQLITKNLENIGFSLKSKLLIPKADYSQILSILIAEIERKNVLNEIEWTLVASTNKLNDHVIDKAIDDISKGRVLKTQKIKYFDCDSLNLYEDHIFMLKNETFYFHYSLVIQHLKLNSNKIFLTFNEQSEFDQFKNKLSKLTNLDNVKISTCSNYFKFCLELDIDNSQELRTIRSVLSKELSQYTDVLISTNAILADSYLYEFKYFFNHDKFFESRSDICFLLKKINFEVFLKKLHDSLRIIEESLRIYGIKHLCLSFNGGKDCLVVLYLFYGVCLLMGMDFPINILLIKIDHQFDEMNEFVERDVLNFFGHKTIEFITFEAKPMKECLRSLKETNPNINGILMGTRRTDSEYLRKMNAFALTDQDWPEYMRVSPILEWTYSEIWFLIRLLKLPYCSLYDNGFTSIDTKLNTVPNENLSKPNNQGYFPAYLLDNQETERTSRKNK